MLRKLKKQAKKNYNRYGNHKEYTVWLRRKAKRYYNEPIIDHCIIMAKPKQLPGFETGYYIKL